MKFMSPADTVHCFLLVFPRCKCMPSMKPLSHVETEHFDHVHTYKDVHQGYHISTPLLRKGKLKVIEMLISQLTYHLQSAD